MKAFSSAFLVMAAALLFPARELWPAERAAGPYLDHDRLSQVVDETMARLEETGARWTVIILVKQRAEAQVDVVHYRGQRKSTIAFRMGETSAPLLEIIDRDGGWYVKEREGAFGRYRPYEAPFFLATAYALLDKGELFVAPPDLSSLGTLEGVADGVAHFRQPLPNEGKRLMREMLSQLDAVADEVGQSAEMEATRKSLKDLLEYGIPCHVDLDTGILIKHGSLDLQVRIERFEWLESVPDDAFTLHGEYPDHTSDPTTGDLNAWVMIGHSGTWRPTMEHNTDADIRLLNVRTGELRRVPFLGATALPGCFLKDRKRVVVTGVMSGRMGLGLYEVDLSTGENRELGGEVLANGFCFDPCVSPDGKLIAVKFMKTPNPTRPSQIYVVDVKSGDARKIGEIVGGIHLTWMPDGKHVLMMREEFVDWRKTSVGTICTMAFDGTIEDIREGEWPVLIGDSKIMFTPRGERVWHTCNLDGSNVKILGDGLGDYGFPTVSPSGTYLLMMGFGGPRGPRPTLIKVGESSGREAVELGGLWAFPAWQ
ncbi:MAG: hypothetical protein JW889_06325 [Verrucomicrobia bacterium]|nr:hypothetical protein [Verrucomicrobiota bacterium]